MDNFDQTDKETLQDLVEAGYEVSIVAYDPGDVVGDPEAAAASNGWVEHYREDSADLVEVIYVRRRLAAEAGRYTITLFNAAFD